MPDLNKQFPDYDREECLAVLDKIQHKDPKEAVPELCELVATLVHQIHRLNNKAGIA